MNTEKIRDEILREIFEEISGWKITKDSDVQGDIDQLRDEYGKIIDLAISKGYEAGKKDKEKETEQKIIHQVREEMTDYRKMLREREEKALRHDFPTELENEKEWSELVASMMGNYKRSKHTKNAYFTYFKIGFERAWKKHIAKLKQERQKVVKEIFREIDKFYCVTTKKQKYGKPKEIQHGIMTDYIISKDDLDKLKQKFTGDGG